MNIAPEAINSLNLALGYGIIAAFVAFLWAPILIKFLYKFNITRRNEYDTTLNMMSRLTKRGTPIMGGLLVIITVAVFTMAFNWTREFTYVPVGVMLLSALLGGVDDVLNIFGTKRRNRKLGQIFTLIRVHRSLAYRIWLIATLPWSIFKRMALALGSNPGRGVHVHEKLLLQFASGAITAWWIYSKLGVHWREIHIPFDGMMNFGVWIIPLVIFFVMFTANAVNVADGMDGLAGGSLILTFSALTFLSWFNGYNSLTILNATTAGALLAYTYFNIKPARFQMGDVGSLGLGALLAINTIVIKEMFLLPLLAFIFFVELISVIIQIFGRFFLGKRILKMSPLHYHFALRGWSEEKTVMRFWIIHAAMVILGVWIALH
jgi:phospho-N-acetylmuramoyl-pentapeptide-transferase